MVGMTHKSRIWYSVHWATTVQAERDIQSKRFSNKGPQTLSAMRMCASGRYGNFVGCRMKAVHWACRSVRVWCGRRWVNSIYQRAPIIASWNWRARSRIWPGVKRSSPRIWRRRCNIARSWWWDKNYLFSEDGARAAIDLAWGLSPFMTNVGFQNCRVFRTRSQIFGKYVLNVAVDRINHLITISGLYLSLSSCLSQLDK